MWKCSCTVTFCLWLGLTGSAPAADTPPEAPAAAPTNAARDGNRLRAAANPYLLSHAYNPVDWYPWGSEALEKARRENKPIFLSVGYSTCYWCHVAEQTIYSNPDIAQLMNQWYVNIKVDCEERPDLDGIYMLATQLITGHSGWPNNVFLTPDLKPFHAGSYFPPNDDEFGRPGFTTLLRTLHEEWIAHPEQVRERADRVAAAMKTVQARREMVMAGPSQPADLMKRSRDALLKHFDPKYGGFGFENDPAKFPHAPILDLLIADYRANRTAASLDALTRSLDAMAAGGIHDHLAGGFHRYSIEPTWSIPHFEKMLYDNAQLLGVYADAFQLTRIPRYRRIALRQADYLRSRLMAPDGGFYTAEDASVGAQEGASYLWSKEEIESALGASDAARLLAHFQLTPAHQPFAESALQERGVLRLRLPAAASAVGAAFDTAAADAPLLARLLAVRQARPQPARDDKLVVALNALAIDALARSSAILREPRLLDMARRAGERIWALAYEDRTSELKHQVFRGEAKGVAFLDDYALLGRAYLALHDASGNKLWLQRAARLGDDILKRFALPDGSLRTAPADQDLLLDPRDTAETVYPAGLSATVDLLQRLSAVEPRFRQPAQPILRRATLQLAAAPASWPFLASVLRAPSADRDAAPLDSAAHVKAGAVAVERADHDEVIVTLTIDAGFHINANPASHDYLVPTTLTLADMQPTHVRYPPPTRFKPGFQPGGLDVYEGKAQLIAYLPKGTLAARRNQHAVVRVQACDDKSCLAPADLRIDVVPGR